MASSINALTTGSGGVITTADNSGDLNIQSGGSTKIAVTSAGANIVGTLTVNGAAPAYGKVLQVVQGTLTTILSTSSSTYSDTGVTATITPTSATSKVLVLAQLSGCGKGSSNTTMHTRIVKNGSLLVGMDIGACTNGGTGQNYIGSIVANYLDSPASTSALTYKIQFNSFNNTSYVEFNNQTGGASGGTSLSSITLMEIAA
jgi:hypothetical protein